MTKSTKIMVALFALFTLVALGMVFQAKTQQQPVSAQSPDGNFLVRDDLTVRRGGGSGLTDPVALRLHNTTKQGSSQIVFEEGSQGNNMTIRYNSSSDGKKNGLEFMGYGNVHMRIERDSGNVGIGTSKPIGALELNTTGKVGDAATFRLIGNHADIVQVDEHLDLVSAWAGNGTIRFFTHDAADDLQLRMVIHNNGEICMGTGC